LIVGVFLLIGLFAMPLGGVLSDRLSRVSVIEISLILAGFLLFIFTISEDVISLAALMLASFSSKCRRESTSPYRLTG
jgi:nitrate/nitrite transporter NarK